MSVPGSSSEHKYSRCRHGACLIVDSDTEWYKSDVIKTVSVISSQGGGRSGISGPGGFPIHDIT